MSEQRFEGDEGAPESSERKRERAVEFIRRIRAMDRENLHGLILREAGEELAQFFLTYATDLMAREPERAVQNASSLLLIGYLIRGHETDRPKAPAPASAWVH
ncbi:MAG: hypothetical protein NVS2B9_12220 [Myxococcales bacterium]